MATVQLDRIGTRFRTSEKNAVQQAFTPSLSVDLHQPLGNLCGAIVLFGWPPEPFPKAIMDDGRIRTHGDAWQHAIGNVNAVPACCPDGLILSSIVVGIGLFNRTGREGGEMVFRHRVAVYAEPRAQGQSYKELISCLSPRVV
jgi:hypothetical protein